MFTWPLDDYIITRDFYYLASLYVGGQHAALDLIRRTGTTCAAPIRAIARGIVVGVGWDMYSGFFVAVSHIGGWRSTYRHLFGMTPVVVGQQVSQGQIIGNVGNTGWSQGDHLHFDLWNLDEIRDDDAIFEKNDWYAVDPAYYLGKKDEDMDEERMREIAKEEADFAVSVNNDNRGVFNLAQTNIIQAMINDQPPHYNVQDILDHLPGLNAAQRDIIKQMIQKLAPAGGGISAEESRAIAQEEDDKQGITKG